MTSDHDDLIERLRAVDLILAYDRPYASGVAKAAKEAIVALTAKLDEALEALKHESEECAKIADHFSNATSDDADPAYILGLRSAARRICIKIRARQAIANGEGGNG